MAVGKYWKQPFLRRYLRDGLIAYGRVRYVLMAGCSQALVTILLAFPLWFIGRCVLLDSVTDVLEGTFCRPFPFLYTIQWWQFVVLAVIASLLYVALYRWMLQRNWAVRLGGYYITPAALFALVFGIQYGRWIVLVMTDTGTVTSFGQLVTVFSGPAIVWVWHVHTTLWMKWCAYTLLPDDEAAVIVSRMVLARGGFVQDKEPVAVRRDGARLIVTGGLDAVATGRLHDLVTTSYPEELRVVVQTTLDDETYYKHDRDRLARTRFDEEPLAPPAEIPAAALVGVIVLFVVTVAAAFIYGPGLAPGITGEDLRSFSVAQQRALSLERTPKPEPDETVAKREAELAKRGEGTLAVAAFALDLSTAEAFCPRLVQSAPQRIFRMDTEHLVGMYMNPEDPTDTTRYGDTVLRVHAYYNGTYTFAFDRRTGACVEQRQYPTIAAARDAAQRDRRVVPGRWLDVPTDDDWHVVPPMPLAD